MDKIGEDISPTSRLSADALRALQWSRLQPQIAYNYANAPFYRERFDAIGLAPGDIRDWSDFTRVPTMDKHDHREAQDESIRRYGHPFGMLACVPVESFSFLSATSGTTGTPTFYTLTDTDMKIYSELMARKLRLIRLKKGDRVIHGFALSMMVGGQPVLQLIKNYGACVVPVGAEVGSLRLLEFAKLVKPRMLIGTPSYAEYLADKCQETIGIPPRELGFEIIVCGGEPGASLPHVRQKIESAYGAKLYDYTGAIHTFHGITCGMSDIGMHYVSEDHCVLELLDPETKKPIPVEDGAIGEMVYTELGIEATPLMRYALGDILQISTAPCACGFRGKSFKILGRADDMLIVKGVNVYPAAIRNVVNGLVPRTTGQIRVVLDAPGPRVIPPLKLIVEHGPDVPPGERARLSTELENLIHDKLKVRPEIRLVEAGTLARTSHKSKLVEIRAVDRA